MTDLEWLARTYRWPESDAGATCAVISLSTGARVWILVPKRTSGYTRDQWLGERQRIASMRDPEVWQNHRIAESAMEAIIDRHMEAAFEQINREFADTPTHVALRLAQKQHALHHCLAGTYIGCRVSLGGD